MLVIIDKYSRFTWVIFLRKKNHDADKIISFAKQCEVLYDYKVTQLRNDHGTEFYSSNLEEFCKAARIFHNFSDVLTPQ